ncbi:unnamed protein product [Brachionus calyciflorus]|uniref:Uncharacterized protein n=1 Tax=Brachionus calyciflorus TaxID=104777 RepID=A0A813LVP2_9BILA|nr:unnamed protein product [Brachionus calyciflorus]
MISLRVTLFLVILLTSLNLSESLTRFIHGRRFYHDEKQIRLFKIKNNITDLYYDQELDHFNEAESRTWKQRYWVNDEFFERESGPVFLMIGGEGEENPIWMKKGNWVVLAQKYNALLVMLEHRFYGKSRPTEDMSTDNLKYLSSEQGLADLATFRQFIHTSFNLTNSNKWISFGGSYPGSLSAWFRLKYPHLVHAAVSSSAPMLALVNFTDYLVVVNNSLYLYSPSCPRFIAQAMSQIEGLMMTPGGRSTLEKLFRTCDSIDSDLDVANFYSAVIGNFEEAVQYNKDNRLSRNTTITIDLLCDTMDQGSIGDPLTRYATVNDIFLEEYGQKCLDISYKKFIDEMKSVSWESSASEGGRQWTYQTCVEFGFYQSTDSPKHPFGQNIPADFYINQCKDIFGSEYDLNLLQRAVRDTNTNYGGYTYEGSRVVFVNGEIDPWHALGFTGQPPNSNTETIFIKGTAHCADLYPSSQKDPASLTQARNRIDELIGQWLTQ